MPGAQEAFVASGVWRSTRMEQLECSVSRLQALADQGVWDEVITSLEGQTPQ